MTLNIQDILSRLDRNDLTVFNTVPTNREDRKELSKNISWMIPQWMIGAHTPSHHRNFIIMFDEACNTGWGTFYKHPELQTKLLSLIGTGKTVRHKFYRPQGSRVSSNVDVKIMEMLQHEYLDIRDSDVMVWCRCNGEKEFDELLTVNGIIDNKERAVLHKQYDRMRAME